MKSIGWRRHFRGAVQDIFWSCPLLFQNITGIHFKKFPLDNPFICNSVWVNVPERLQVSWENVQFFVDTSPGLMGGIPVDTLYEEFIDYQSMNDSDIGDEAWEGAKVLDGVKNDINDENNSYHHRFDILW